MGGGGHGGFQPLKHDPKIDAWAYMRENVWRHFRFTNRTTRTVLLWGVLVPYGVYQLALREDLKWDLQGARRDDPIARFGKYSQKPSERQAAQQAAAGEDDE